MKNNQRFYLSIVSLFSVFMVSFNTTSVNAVLPFLQNTLHLSLPYMQWILISYLLGCAVTMPISHYFSENFGILRLFKISINVFFITSIAALLINNYLIIVILRFLQGLCAGFIVPSSVTLIKLVANKNLNRYITARSTFITLGFILGPSVSIFLSYLLNWRAFYWVISFCPTAALVATAI